MVSAVLEGVRGQEDVVAGVVLAALRSRGEQHGVATARLADTLRQVGRQGTGLVEGELWPSSSCGPAGRSGGDGRGGGRGQLPPGRPAGRGHGGRGGGGREEGGAPHPACRGVAGEVPPLPLLPSNLYPSSHPTSTSPPSQLLPQVWQPGQPGVGGGAAGCPQGDILEQSS